VDEMIIQHLSGTLSPFEEERLRHWRGTNPENEAYFQDMVEVWNLTAPEAIGHLPGPPPVETILAAAPLAVEGDEKPSTRDIRRPGRAWLRWGALAATLAAVGLGLKAIRFSGPDALAEYTVTDADPVTLTLQDGSFVRLAQGATLREWDVEGRREVSLEGRGFFAVARNEDRPFVVRTSVGDVQVLGTRFQVDASEEWVETVVVEGLVRVSNEAGSVQVPAGGRARMAAGASPEVSAEDDVFALLDWAQGALVFQATPLANVVEEVSRHYGRQIILSDADLSRRRVTAWFQGEPFEAVAESLCMVTEATCEIEEDRVTMGMGGRGGAG
jgi:transmembrane sensor